VSFLRRAVRENDVSSLGNVPFEEKKILTGRDGGGR
jgi:hypothetical protein